MIKWLKSLFKPKKEGKTFEEMVEYINTFYHFNRFEEELVDEIYTLMLDYGSVKVTKINQYKYLVSITDTDTKVYEINQEGFIEVK